MLKKQYDVKKDVKYNKIKKILKKSFSLKYLSIYIVTLLASMVTVNGWAPFGLAILIAAMASDMTIGVIYIIAGIGTFIGAGASALGMYVIVSMIFFALILIRRPKIEENVNEKNKLGGHLIVSLFIVQALKMIISKMILYDVLSGIVFIMLVYVFYKIFVNALVVLMNYKDKHIFSIEEVIGLTVLLSIAILSVGDLNVFGFSAKVILSILVVMILGWQNGIMVGATAGITVGTIMGLIGNQNPMIIATYALSGLLGGLFSRLGKIGVIIGFFIGNIILTYVDNGALAPVIMLKEILIASIGLLILPDRIRIKVDDFFKDVKMLPIVAGSKSSNNQSTIYKLNSVSSTISDIAKSYKEAAATIIDEEDLKQQEENNKRVFIHELRDYIEDKKDNFLFDDLYQKDSKILSDLFVILLNKDVIDREDLVNTFEKNNNFIVGLNENKNVDNDIKEIVKLLNHAYKVSKSDFIWEKKINDKNEIIGEQFDEVSKVISGIADEIKGKNKDEFEKQKKEIISLLAMKKIQVKSINIKNNNSKKMRVELEILKCSDEAEVNCNLKNVKKIIEKVLKQKFVVEKQNCGRKNSLEYCNIIFTLEDKFQLKVGISQVNKRGNSICGDSILNTNLEDGKKLIVISDGMGTGEKANKISSMLINMLQKLLSAGFDKNTSIKLVNNTILATNKEEGFATLDLSVFDLFEGKLEFIKNGACSTFLKSKNKKNSNSRIQLLKSISMPTGIVKDIDLIVFEKDLKDGDILVMCSDGILDSCKEFSNNEVWLSNLLEEIQTDDPQKIADIIMGEAKDNYAGIIKDDLTIAVIKVIKKK